MKKKLIIILLILVTLISFVVLYQKQLISDLEIYEAQKAGNLTPGDIGVTLVENGNNVAYRNYSSAGDGTWNEKTEGILFENLLQGEEFKPGKQYKEELRILNSGTINTYIRVTIYKYWIYDDGNQEKDTSKDPSLIQLNLINTDVWVEDTNPGSKTPERTVLFYNTPLKAGETTLPFCDSIQIKDENILAKEIEVSNQDGHKVIEIQEEYEGYKAFVQVIVDVVQEHNAEAA